MVQTSLCAWFRLKGELHQFYTSGSIQNLYYCMCESCIKQFVAPEGAA